MARYAFFICLLALVAGRSAVADETAVDYRKQIKPILKARCYACHGGRKQESGLRLDTGLLIRRGGDGGAAIVAGSSKESRLIERISAKDEADRMPPEGEPLTADQIQRIRAWIDAGAPSPPQETPERDPRDHWAFRVPRKPPLPPSDGWSANPIDRLLRAAQKRQRLEPAADANKSALLRRVYLDLIGLPPQRHELAAFLQDTSPDAYERVVDRLLLRPEYGERWGRHWMDVWRYSDWYGRRRVPDALNSYGQIWRWRDWIIRSLNEDKGYDRMVTEMLAADEIAPRDDENLVATGFIVRNYYRWNYNTWMKDIVEHTGKAFLGLSLNCCHCHDHKYDPISNEEYFAFRAFFEPIDIRQDRVPGEADPGLYPDYKLGKSLKPLTSGMVRIHDRNLDAETFMYVKGESRDRIPGRPPIAPAAPAFLEGDSLDIQSVELPAAAWYPGLKSFIRDEALRKASSQVDQATQALAATDKAKDKNAATVAEAKLAWTRSELAAIQARVRADQVRFEGREGEPNDVSQAASRAERQLALDKARHESAVAQQKLSVEQAKNSTDEKAKKALAQAEKAATAAGAKVEQLTAALEAESTDYAPFSPRYPRRSTGRRSALARWMTSRDNPLTARVAVNHLWGWHFGRPIVATTENLGVSGDPPSHPLLLDWLAVELMENGWRMKRLHRLIVTSRAYRMSSNPADASDKNRSLDADNRFLWRFPSRRVEAEVIRDSILQASGRLNAVIGGAEIPDSQGLTTPRRSLYFETHGEGQMPFLKLFDSANPIECYRRTTSVRPQQALAMANSELALRQARRLARALHAESGDDASFIVAAFEQVLTRAPSPEELRASLEFLPRQTKLLKSSDLKPSAKEALPPSADPIVRARENFVHALFSHSDFVTLR